MNDGRWVAFVERQRLRPPRRPERPVIINNKRYTCMGVEFSLRNDRFGQQHSKGESIGLVIEGPI
jgi:hypothetical protein